MKGETRAVKSLGRALRTPLLDLARGQIADEGEVAHIISAANLPRSVAELVVQVTRRTRLWPAEQLDVARELVAHFHDGIEAGVTAAQLVADFGNPRTTARLIRRARLRRRSFAARAARRAKQGLVALGLVTTVLYAFVAIEFHTSARSVPSWRLPAYITRINESVLHLPESERAWPRYDSATAHIEAVLGKSPGQNSDENLLHARPDDTRWPHLVDALRSVRSALDDVRAAASLPNLGFELRVDENQRWRIWTETARPLEVFQLLPWVLRRDALRAIQERDGEAAYKNIVTLIGISRHARQTEPSWLWDTIGFSILSGATEALVEVVSQTPELLASGQLTDLSHRLVAVGGRDSFRFRTAADRAKAQIYWERLYPEGGGDDVRVSKEGLERLGQLSTGTTVASAVALRLTESPIAAPAFRYAIVSRGDLLETARSVFAAVDAQLDLPLWRRDPSAIVRGVQDLRRSIRYLPFRYDFPDHDLKSDELTLGQRDAALVVIALDLYRRRHGEWPTNLEALTSDLLPAVPLDRYDGQPLRYRVVDGHPLLYSVGPDRDDDGGSDGDWVFGGP